MISKSTNFHWRNYTKHVPYLPTQATYGILVCEVPFQIFHLNIEYRWVENTCLWCIHELQWPDLKIGCHDNSPSNEWRSGPQFNTKISSNRYRKSHCGDKTVVRSSYLHNGISYTGKMTSLYWIRAKGDMLHSIFYAIFMLFSENETVILGEPFTFEDVSDPEYQPRNFKAQWLGGKWFVSDSYPNGHILDVIYTSTCFNMMTSSNGNIFRVTGPLCGEFTGPRWIPRTKASDAELWCFLWSVPE